MICLEVFVLFFLDFVFEFWSKESCHERFFFFLRVRRPTPSLVWGIVKHNVLTDKCLCSLHKTHWLTILTAVTRKEVEMYRCHEACVILVITNYWASHSPWLKTITYVIITDWLTCHMTNTIILIWQISLLRYTTAEAVSNIFIFPVVTHWKNLFVSLTHMFFFFH